jgi:V8-like Glu-specific endopeptidase
MDQIVSHSTNQTHEEIRKYWTAERIAAAEPIELPVLDRPPRVTKQPGAQVEREAVAPATEDESTPCFTTSKVSDLSDSPYQYVGKLYMTFKWSTGSKNYTGSAFCVSKCGIITAGHCLYG